MLTDAKATEVPSDYRPYEQLLFCSNQLRNVRYPLMIENHVPLLIGVGTMHPRIWLLAPTDNTREVWSYVVEDNVSRHPNFVVKPSPLERAVRVTAGGNLLLLATALTASSAEVEQLDLTPIGLRVTGTRTKLMIGTNTISNSTASGGEAFIGLG